MNQEKSFGAFVRQRRREMDLTQEELARRVGCAAITLRKIEADDLRASVQIAERLAMALAIPLEERAEFVRWARSVRPAASDLPQVTPPPSMEEIGREDLTGRAIRGYALAERIGMGGMGSVYRAVQPNVDREVAVKIILPAFANHPDFIRRFEAEAQLVARLEHPHIVPLYDYWREPGFAYLVMRLLRGGNVQHLLERGPLALEMVTGMLDQVCSALNAAHRIGVIHRDLKPANVLLDEDNNAYLADFGIAKNLGNPDLESQTQTDAVIGSPQYMSPEQIRSLTVRPQTDVYCLGVMLYEMLTGVLPFNGPTPWEMFQQHISTPMPPLSAHRPGLPSALDAVIARATAKDPDARYADTLSMLQQFRQAVGQAVGEPVHIIAYDEEDTEAVTTNPFKGLRAFGEADAENFFGRETLVQQLLARLAEGGELSRFLAVIGPSGSGKSSVVRAGLVPALRRGGLPGSENWFVVDMLPGKHPFEELEAALLRVAVNPPESLLSQLKDGNRGLLRAVHRILPADESVELVLLIDQFEEVFTLVEDESERALLLESLAAAVMDERSRLRVVVTLRADFIDRPLRYVDFGEMMDRRFEFVLPLTPDEVERAIAGPAQHVGLKLEKGLVSSIIRDTGDQPGTLPLLQYALSELFERRDGRLLSNKAYKEIGGVLGALGRSAEKVFTELSETNQAVARQLFLRLVTLGEGTEDTRRRVLRTELEGISPATGPTQQQDWSAVIDRFGKARLLSFDRDPITRGATVEVAHEALLKEWSRLREWLNGSRADVRLQRQLATAANDWRNANCDESFLMSGARLEQFEGWDASTSIDLTQDERTFLDTSITVRDRLASDEQARQQRELAAARRLAETERQSALRLRMRNRVITGVGILAIILAIMAGSFGVSSNRNAENALNAQATSQADAASRATAEADAIYERNEAQRQSLIASVRELSSEANLSLTTDPERSILLALQAAEQTYSVDGTVLREAEYALRRAVLASRIELRIEGHQDIVWAVTYSPDGTRIASSSADGTAIVWDAGTGRQLLNLSGQQGEVFGVAFSPDGTLLVTAGGDGTARTWDANTGTQLDTLTGHSGEVYFAVFSPDQKIIATASTDGTARIWNADTGEQLLLMEAGNEGTRINQLDFSPDGKRLVLACEEGEAGWASVWDTTTGEQLFQLEGHTIQVRSATFSPDGSRLVTGSADRTVKIWDASDGRELRTLYGNTDVLGSVDFSPDSSRVVTAGWDRIVRIWDAYTGQQLFSLPGHTDRIWSAAFSPDGTKVVTGGSDKTIRVWRLTPRELLTVMNEPSLPSPAPAWVAYSPDGTRIAASNINPSPEVWDIETGERLFKLVGHTQIVRGLVYSTDGTLIATASDDRSVKLWDAATGQETRTIPTSHQDVVVSVALSPDGTQVATSSFDRTAKIWDASNGRELLTLTGHEEAVVHLTFSPDGKRLATASFDTTAKIWDVESGELLLTLAGHDDALRQISFSSDGKRIVTASFDGTAKVWDAETGQEIVTLTGHSAFVFSAVFSPDDKTIATGSPDGTAKIWDAVTGKELLTLDSDISGVTNVAFSPDGSRLVTANRDGTDRIFLLHMEDLMALARTRVTRSLTLDECQQFLHMNTCPALP